MSTKPAAFYFTRHANGGQKFMPSFAKTRHFQTHVAHNHILQKLLVSTVGFLPVGVAQVHRNIRKPGLTKALGHANSCIIARFVLH